MQLETTTIKQELQTNEREENKDRCVGVNLERLRNREKKKRDFLIINQSISQSKRTFCCCCGSAKQAQKSKSTIFF